MGADDIVNLVADKVKYESKKKYQIAMLVVTCVFVVGVGMQTQARPLETEALDMKEASEYIKNNKLSAHKIISTHVWFYYFYGLEWAPDEGWTNPPALETVETGTVVVWDRYSDRVGDFYERLKNPKNGWKKLMHCRYNNCIIFQKNEGGEERRRYL